MEIKKEWLEYAKVNEEKYSSMYDHSLQNNDEFWAEQARRVDWINTVSYTHLTLPTILLV